MDDERENNADVVDMCIEIAPFESNDFGEYTIHYLLTETIAPHTPSFDVISHVIELISIKYVYFDIIV